MKNPRRKSRKTTTPKPPPIVIVPDKTYIDDTGNLIPTDIILISDPTVYSKIRMSLAEMANRSPDDKSK